MIGSLLVAQLTWATTQLVPSPVVSMGEQAARVADILLNRQLAQCVSEFQQESAVITDVTIQEGDARTSYVIKGEILTGGDVITGEISLIINETKSAGYGFGTTTEYACNVVKKSLR